MKSQGRVNMSFILSTSLRAMIFSLILSSPKTGSNLLADVFNVEMDFSCLITASTKMRIIL